MPFSNKAHRTIFLGEVFTKAPKNNYQGGNIKILGGRCNNACSAFPSRIRNNLGENPYDKHAYCRRCSKYIFKELLHENKNGAKILCPCCHAFARLTPSTSARNRTRRNREAQTQKA
jgi:predicted sulfurtransferase